MRRQEIYGPIKTKLNEWITYDKNAPKVPYQEDPKAHDAYRKAHDRDCVLTDGNLNADTIFSLWLPLRNTIVCLNDEQTIKEVGNIYDKMSFVRALVQDGNLEKLLPDNRLIVYKLGQLFKWGMRRANVIILPKRWLNSARAKKPYYDYMPAFLLESFPGGAFASAWNDLEDFKEWVQREDLYMFFEGEIKPENIIDLAGTGDLKSSFPLDGAVGMERLIDRYIEILRERNTYLRMKRRRNSANLREYYTNQEKNNQSTQSKNNQETSSEPNQKEVSMQMNLPTKQIFINNFSNVEKYLEINSPLEETLKYVELNLNSETKGVKELLQKIPSGFRPELLKKFYEETGLKIQVQVFKNYEMTMYDREGQYPREDAYIWNRDFMEKVSEHPEWLEPQEDADIIIRICLELEMKGEDGTC